MVEECFRARKQNHKSELLRKRKKASVTSAQEEEEAKLKMCLEQNQAKS